MPDDFSIAPMVDAYCLAANSDNPNCFFAFLAKLLLSSDILPNVTSTTFCTSCRSDDRDIHSFANGTAIFIAANAAPATPAAFVNPDKPAPAPAADFPTPLNPVKSPLIAFFADLTRDSTDDIPALNALVLAVIKTFNSSVIMLLFPPFCVVCFRILNHLSLKLS